MNAKTEKYVGLLIDPKAHTITEVEWDGDYKSIYKLIDADLFDVVRIDNDDTIFVDDEGLINGTAGRAGMFAWEASGGTAFLAGKGLILGTKGEHTVGAKTDMMEAKARVDFGYPVRMAGQVLFSGQRKLHSMEGW